MKNSFILMAALTFSLMAHAQTPVNPVSVKFSGFVKTDVFYDNRQVSPANGIREGHFFLIPDNVLYDADSNDLNANPSFHILNIQTRLRADLTGPEAFGAKTSAVMEAEFFGTSETDLNGFRLRHAYIQLDWTKYSLVAGQTWHPMFPAESFPGTLSFNTGAPFTPFSRNPQVKLTRHLAKADVILTAYSQRDFTSTGPEGSSNKYMRNSALPGLDLQVKYPLTSSIMLSAGGDFKTLRPEIKTSANYETTERISSFATYLKMKIQTKPLNISLMGTYAQNATDLMMLGGYAVESITDTLKKFKTYANIAVFSGYLDISTNGSRVKAGLFAGYSQNLGAGKDLSGPVYARGSSIASLWRLSPRCTFTRNSLTFGTELEITSAAYGKIKPDASVEETDPVTHFRLLISAIYKF